MTFSAPVPLNQALNSSVARVVVPLRTRTVLAHDLPLPLLRRSKFLAGESQASTLQKVNDAILEIVRGENTEGAERSLLNRLPEILDDRELAKESRLRLILDTNADLARGWGGHLQSMDADVLDEFPCWEFYRAEDRDEPRDWPARWEEAGGEFYPGAADYPEGRMIALKTDDIWSELSRFGTPWAPFDFNSGMDLREIDRDEAERLGIIEPQTRQEPELEPFNDELEAHSGASGDLLGALGAYLIGEKLGELAAGGVVKLFQ